MNKELKAQHMETITDPRAVQVYGWLCDACERREGGMTNADQMLVASIARCEQVQQALIADIKERGIGKEYSNGRQKYYQENKSIAKMFASAEQQRKLMAELRLTPSARKATPVTPEDDFDGY